MMRPAKVPALLLLGLVLGLFAGGPAVAHAQDSFVLIANAANPISTLSRSEASKLFLLKRTRWTSGQRAQPVDQVESSAVRRQFSNAIHGMDVPSVKSFWQEIVFSGKGDPPPERASDAQVLAYVRSRPNGLGYVAASTRADGVKIIALTP
jgi:ABC-type phosphate transport system substrate-binding protein